MYNVGIASNHQGRAAGLLESVKNTITKKQKKKKVRNYTSTHAVDAAERCTTLEKSVL